MGDDILRQGKSAVIYARVSTKGQAESGVSMTHNSRSAVHGADRTVWRSSESSTMTEYPVRPTTVTISVC